MPTDNESPAATAGVERDLPPRGWRSRVRSWPVGLYRDAGDRKRFWVILGVIMLLGFGIRMAFILIRQSKGLPISEVPGDAFWYHFQAKLVAAGKGFLHPFEYYNEGVEVAGADHPPGFVVVLAALDKIGLDSAQMQRAAMAALGTCSIAVIGSTGRRMGGAPVGLVAAFLAAVYPNIWINDGMLMVETVFIFGIALSLLCTYRFLADGGRWNVAGISAGFTVAALTRPEAALLLVFFLTPLLLFRKQFPWQERFVQLAIAALIPICCYTPWLAYNMTRFDNPVLVSTGAGQALVVANCDLTYEGKNLGYWDRNCLFPPHSSERTVTDSSSFDAEMQAQARDYMLDHIPELPKVMAARVGRMWGVFRPGQSIVLDGYIEGRAGGPPGTDFGLVRDALWAYWVLAPLSVVGAALMWRRRVPISPLVAQVALATFTATITYGITRYRAGAEIAIVLGAAFAIVVVWRKLFPSSGPDSFVTPILPEDSTDEVPADGEKVAVQQ